VFAPYGNNWGGEVEQATSVISVLLVDDSAHVRRTLSWRLGFEQDIRVVGQAARSNDALSLARSLLPDVIIMDVHMQGTNDLALVRELRWALPQSALVILTADGRVDRLRTSLEDDNCTVVSKYQPPDVLLTAIRAAAARKVRNGPHSPQV